MSSEDFLHLSPNNLPAELRRHMTTLANKRVAPDVSVLLAGILDPGSFSNQSLAMLRGSVVVLGKHVEDMARRVLRFHAPHLLGDFGDGLVRLARYTTVVRPAALDRSELPIWAGEMSGEDQEVLADALDGDADYLLTHDSVFFRRSIPGLRVESPSAFAWTARDPRNFEHSRKAWTFIGIFWPNWSTKAVENAERAFYMFDLPPLASYYYAAKQKGVVFELFRAGQQVVKLEIPLSVRHQVPVFVAAAVDQSGILVLANDNANSWTGSTGILPSKTKLFPFNNSHGEGQVSGGCRFRMAGRRLSEKRLRRLFRSRSLQLSDGELRFSELTSTIGRHLNG